MMNKVLASIAIAQFTFLILCIFVLVRYREQLFQVRSRLLIWSLLGIELFFVVVHYTLGLPSDYAIVFVIIQEYFKISTFLYVIFFYLKQAMNYSEEEKGKIFIKYMKIAIVVFAFVLAVTLFVWAVLRVTRLITDQPWRDWTWLLYRSVTLLLVVTIIFVGLYVQKKVKLKSDGIVESIDDRLSSMDVSDSDEAPELYVRCNERTEKEITGKFYLTSSFNRKQLAITKTLRHMWICFSMIIFICVFDVAYNLYWRININADNWSMYTNNDLTNAIIFVVSRFISLLLPFFPVIYAFMGWEFMGAVLCCCCRRVSNSPYTNLDTYYLYSFH